MSVPSSRKVPKPYAVSNWRWRSHAPQRARNASRSMIGSRVPGSGSGSHRSSQSRLRVRISRHASWSRASSGRSMTRGPDQGRVATSSHRAKVIHYPDPMPTNGDKGRRAAGLARSRDDRSRRRAPRHRRDRRARHRRRPRTARRRHRPHRPPAAERARGDGRLRARPCTRSRGCSPEIEASTLSLADAGAQVLDYMRGARRTRAAHRCAATRSASTGGSSTASSPSSTSSCTTAASTCRASRSCAGAGTRRLQGRPGKTETHRALADVLESIAELQLLPRAHAGAEGRAR